jgi:hypothetical protein
MGVVFLIQTVDNEVPEAFMRWLCSTLAILLMLPPPPARAQDATVSLLNIVVVEGEGAINNIRQRTAREPIVQVEDQNHKPVAGAAVTFSLPSRGASGVFPNGSRTVTVLTDNQGRAAANGLKPNTVKGRVEIHVNASASGKTATAVIVQTNVVGAAAAGAAAGGISAKLLIGIVAVAGAAAAGGAIAATRGGGSSTSTVTGSAPTTISPGPGTVGPPR